MYCHKCGAENNPESAYCKNCGAKLKRFVQPAMPAEQTPSVKTDGELHDEPQPEASSAQAPLNEGLDNLQWNEEEQAPKSGKNAIVIAVVAIVVLIGGYLLFAYNKPMWPFSNSDQPTEVAEEAPVEYQLEQRVRNEILNAIPDHGFDKTASEGYMTDELFKLLEEAYAIPRHPEIEDAEFLYFLLSGTDSEPMSIKDVKVTLEDDNHATAMVETNLGRHDLSLVKEHDEWVLADFDGQMQTIGKYVENKRNYFSSGSYLSESDGSQIWNEYIAEVKEYMRKYGVSANENSQAEAGSSQIEFKGKIDKYPIVMCLTFSDDQGEVKGWYYYASKGASNKIQLRGTVEYEPGARYGSLNLNEYVGDNHTGTFSGSYGFDSSESNRGNTYSGTWTSPSGKQLEFDLADGNGLHY